MAAPRVTMLSVAWASELYDSSLDTMLDAWNGPKALILAYSAVLEEERVDEVSHSGCDASGSEPRPML